MYEEVWSASCMKKFGLPPVWRSLVCQLYEEVWSASCMKKFGLPAVWRSLVCQLYEEVWSATCMKKFGLPAVWRSLVYHLPPVAWLIGTSTTKNVFLWYRFQGHVHLSFEVFNDVHLNKIIRKWFLFLSKFSVFRPKWVKRWLGDIASLICNLHLYSTASLAQWLRRPPPERKIRGSNPAWAGIFPGRVIRKNDLKIDTPVATLPAL